MRRFRLRAVRGQQRGFTLVECIMALAVMGVGLAALFQTLFVSSQSNRFSREIGSATYLANAFMEQIRRRAVIWDPQRAERPPLFALDPRAHWRQIFPDLPLVNDVLAAPAWCDAAKTFCPVTTFLDNPDFNTQGALINPDTGHWELDDTGQLNLYTDVNTQFIFEYRAQDMGMIMGPDLSGDSVRLSLRVSWSNKEHGPTANIDYPGLVSDWNRRVVLFDTILTGGYLTEPQGT